MANFFHDRSPQQSSFNSINSTQAPAYSQPAPSNLALIALLWLLTAAVGLLSAPSMVEAIRHVVSDSPGRAVVLVGRPTLVLPAPAPPFVAKADTPADLARATDCLAQAIYYEAGFEPEAGQRAVAQVVLNRVRDRNFPDTVCGVVYQGAGRRTGCQFSFVCDGSLSRRPPEHDQLEAARALAAQALNGYVVKPIGAATHYHTDYVEPWWRSTVVQVGRIGLHVFYVWPGKAGLVSALRDRYAGDEVRVWNRVQSLMSRPTPKRNRSRRA
ncbi:MAG TPA: cell wall hydrolase [Caulobacteraceae bacterium]|jgi:hypothetical protein|nr:cell wall hydrolase [Caulobacteraceae bacterium]